jgi:hypothetical protein
VHGTFNFCPVFNFQLVVPPDIHPTEAADITVIASDPDADDNELTFSWSATSGSFSEPSLPETAYRCDGPGYQVLKVSARDAEGCETVLEIEANCLRE